MPRKAKPRAKTAKSKSTKRSKAARAPARRKASAKSQRSSRRAPSKSASAKVLGGPNLLVTIDEHHRDLAQQEIGAALDRLPGISYEFTDAPGQGLVGLHLEGMEARECIGKLRELVMADPVAFHHSHRWIPIDVWTKADQAELAKFAQTANAQIAPTESWKIQVERHGSNLDRDLLINAMAKDISNPNVDLDNADKTVLVEVVGEKAGLAVLQGEQVLSIDRIVDTQFVRFTEVKDEG